MSPRITFAALCLAALGAAHTTAQQRPAPLQLVPTGRAFARGDGDVARCLIHDDSHHMLTVGVANDLVWWNLRERKPLRWIPPPDAPILDVQLHPTEPWAVCRLAGGTTLRIDLAGGGLETLTSRQADALTAPAGGWLTGGHAATDDVASRDGRHRIVMVDGRRRRQPHKVGKFFELGTTCWLANDGTAIEAKPGALRIHGLTLHDRTDVHAHCGAPQQLCFTPDGGHLAILSTAATQVVDVAGQEIAHFEGPRLVRPGPQPDEFWLLTKSAMQRWSAPRRANVGNAVGWPGHYLRLLEDSPTRGPRLRQALVRGGQPWTPEFARLPDGTFRALSFTRPRAPVPANGPEQYAWLGGQETALAFQAASDTAAPMLLTSARGDGKFTRDRATLRRLGDDGATTHHVAFDAAALWLAMTANGTHVCVGLAGGSVHLFDSERLTSAKTTEFDRPLTAAVALDEAHLLATTGHKLLRVDAATLAVVDEVPLPQGLRGVDQLVSSADGKRLAIVRGCEVWLLDVQ